MTIDKRQFKVFSAKDVDLEAGYEPFLEGVFLTKEEFAEAFVECWNNVSTKPSYFWVG